MAWTCDHCGGKVDDGYGRCIHCGVGRRDEARSPIRLPAIHLLGPPDYRLLAAAVVVIRVLAVLALIQSLITTFRASSYSFVDQPSLILYGVISGVSVMLALLVVSEVIDALRNTARDARRLAEARDAVDVAAVASPSPSPSPPASDPI